MKGLIIEKLKTNYFTNLKEVMSVLGEDIKKYNWLLTEYFFTCEYLPKIPIGADYAWVTGEELMEILKKYDPIFVWCVASVFDKSVKLEDALIHPLPFADGYTGFWKLPVSIQNPLAEIEIVPWDSSLLLVISRSNEVVQKYADEYPDATDLEKYCREFM
ncbi:MAG: hypothetical protein FWE29_04940 [Defluviitaleaceae bacterium]|nr:hypothetical protein [Defluviitaleaceae bacterium]